MFWSSCVSIVSQALKSNLKSNPYLADDAVVENARTNILPRKERFGMVIIEQIILNSFQFDSEEIFYEQSG